MRQPDPPKGAMKNVLLLKAGDAAHSVRLSVGDYEHWFVGSLAPGGCQLDILHVHRGAKPPDSAAGYDAVMMTGSPLSVTRLEPWMERAAEFMVGAAARGVRFHPEVQPEAMRAMILARAEKLEVEASRLMAGIVPSPAGRRILQNFVERFT